MENICRTKPISYFHLNRVISKCSTNPQSSMTGYKNLCPNDNATKGMAKVIAK